MIVYREFYIKYGRGKILFGGWFLFWCIPLLIKQKDHFKWGIYDRRNY